MQKFMLRLISEWNKLILRFTRNNQKWLFIICDDRVRYFWSKYSSDRSSISFAIKHSSLSIFKILNLPSFNNKPSLLLISSYLSYFITLFGFSAMSMTSFIYLALFINDEDQTIVMIDLRYKRKLGSMLDNEFEVRNSY